MKNSECTIYIMYKDRWTQKFRKEEDGWKEYSRNGTVRPCTAEQFISHLLPPLAGIKEQYVTAKVVVSTDTHFDRLKELKRKPL